MKMSDVFGMPYGCDDVYNLDTVDGGKEAVELAVNNHDKLVEALRDIATGGYGVAGCINFAEEALKGLEDE